MPKTSKPSNQSLSEHSVVTVKAAGASTDAKDIALDLSLPKEQEPDSSLGPSAEAGPSSPVFVDVRSSERKKRLPPPVIVLTDERGGLMDLTKTGPSSSGGPKSRAQIPTVVVITDSSSSESAVPHSSMVKTKARP